MAKATAHCKCEICGKEFEKTAVKANRREADSWEEWAEKNVTVCPSCYGKQKIQEEKNGGLIAKIRFGSPYGEKESVWIVLFGDTFQVKDELKRIGSRWSDEYPDYENGAGILLFGLNMRRPMKRWAICLDLDDLPRKVESLKSIGFSVEFPTDETIMMYKAVRNDVMDRRKTEQAEKDAEKERHEQEKKSALDALGPKPAYSDAIKAFFPSGTKWNRKFYGRSGKYRVYISGEEVFITDEQKAEMEKTLNERDMWEEKRKEILGQ